MDPKYLLRKLKPYWFEAIFISTSIAFSFWLMWTTFSYAEGAMQLAGKVWSDFGNHIPLIRSFSLGNNIPPELPSFSGEPIRYHYLFYYYVGLLEKWGIRIDYALNILSGLSFAALLIVIYFLGKLIFNSRAVGTLGVLLFLFNSSFSFLEFFASHPLSLNTLYDISNNIIFPSFGPYDNKIVSAFWNLNVFTNQRHFALGLAVFLLLVYWIIRQEKEKKRLEVPLAALAGLFLGFMPYLHSSIFFMEGVVLGVLLLILKRQRLPLLVLLVTGFVVAIPTLFFLGGQTSYKPQLVVGYLTSTNLTLLNFGKYWLYNLGLSLFFIPVGFWLAPKLGKQVLFAFLPLFIIGNLFQFSIEMAGNHKFFNVFLIIGNLFSAFVLVKLFKWDFLKPFVVLFFILLTLSGIIDFFAIKNDKIYKLEDHPKNADVNWVVSNTPRNAVFLNSTYLYPAASIAGRKAFMGWPYFAWSQGYNTQKRTDEIKSILREKEKKVVCEYLTKNKIDFVALDRPSEDFPFDLNDWKQNFLADYINPQTGLTIFDVKGSCN